MLDYIITAKVDPILCSYLLFRLDGFDFVS